MTLREYRVGRHYVEFELVLQSKTAQTHSLMTTEAGRLRIAAMVEEVADRLLEYMVVLSDTTAVE